jgi:hypothetical protein
MPKSPVNFTVDGKGVNVEQLRAVSDSIQKQLNILPFGTLLSTQELAIRAGTGERTVISNKPKLRENWLQYGNRSVWGSKKTILAAKERLNG